MTPCKYPIYPSARATIDAGRYLEAVKAVEGVPLVFIDGKSILVPESDLNTIEILRSHYGARIEYGCALEWEFVTKARAAGVSERLVRLGNAVWDVTGQSVADMIQVALDSPTNTYAEWYALYIASMETH